MKDLGISRGALCALALCALFVLLGLLLIPYPGVQTDEALFAAGLYPPYGVSYSIERRNSEIPIMIMTYVGALKSWVYWVIFKLWHPSAYSTRVPVLLMAAAAIWLFFRWLQRIAGRAAALAGCAILATDTSFLLTATFDWGPVAIQILLTVAALFLITRFHDHGSNRALAGAFFLLGLAFWNKAIFVWTLAALVIASAIILWREWLRLFTFKRAALAGLAFCLGALPLISYNIAYPLETFRGNASYSDEEPDLQALLYKRVYILVMTLNGSALFGYIPNEAGTGAERQPDTVLESLSTSLSDAAGAPRRSLTPYALCAAVALIPVLLAMRSPALRPVLFALLTALLMWLQMALNKGTGGTAHHAVLLWPFPHLAIAAAFAGACRPLKRAGNALLAAATVLICVSAILVTNQYLTNLIRYGSGPIWSDAIFPLAERIRAEKPPAVFTVDWGMLDNLRLLVAGKVPVYIGTDPFLSAQMTGDDRRSLEWMASDPNHLFVGHLDGQEAHTGINASMRNRLAEAGYEKQRLATIVDRNGRPTYELFRLKK